MGNNIDIQFNANSVAAQWMHSKDGGWHDGFSKSNNLGDRYHSGIISVTGLNAYSGVHGNLIRVDFDVDQWPYSGVISQTGLNVVRGNLITILIDSEAATAMHARNGNWLNTFNKNTTWVINIILVSFYYRCHYTENLIVKEYQDVWPHTGIYYGID